MGAPWASVTGSSSPRAGSRSGRPERCTSGTTCSTESKGSAPTVRFGSVGNVGSGAGQFAAPWGVATDDRGRVYVVDYGNNRIQKFSPDGAFLAQWGSFGSRDGSSSRRRSSRQTPGATSTWPTAATAASRSSTRADGTSAPWATPGPGAGAPTTRWASPATDPRATATWSDQQHPEARNARGLLPDEMARVPALARASSATPRASRPTRRQRLRQRRQRQRPHPEVPRHRRAPMKKLLLGALVGADPGALAHSLRAPLPGLPSTPEPPRIPEDFSATGRYLVPDLGINVRSTHTAREQRQQPDGRRRPGLSDLVHEHHLRQTGRAETPLHRTSRWPGVVQAVPWSAIPATSAAGR